MKDAGGEIPPLHIMSDYQRFIYRTYTALEANTTLALKRFSVAGDTLHVLDISGSQNIGVRFGDNYSSFIPIRKGMVIKRNFKSLLLGCFDGQT